MPEAQNEELVVDIPTEGSDVSVEISPEQVAVNSVAVESTVSDAEDSAEHEEYSQKVKKRIDKLTKKVREAERQQDAALNYAKNVQVENNNLKSRVSSLDEGYVNEYGDRVATQTESIQKDLESAIATNDTAAQVDLNKKLAQLTIEEERVKAAKLEQARSLQQAQYQAQLAQQQAAQAPQAPARPDPKAEEWATRNSWFGEDDAMTFAAFGIHKTLIEEEGFDTESPEYYNEIDKRLREAFPHKLNDGEIVTVERGRRPSQTVASAVRSSNSGRRTVRLSPSEVAIANKLGVPLDEYAKYKR